MEIYEGALFGGISLLKTDRQNGENARTSRWRLGNSDACIELYRSTDPCKFHCFVLLLNLDGDWEISSLHGTTHPTL